MLLLVAPQLQRCQLLLLILLKAALVIIIIVVRLQLLTCKGLCDKGCLLGAAVLPAQHRRLHGSPSSSDPSLAVGLGFGAPTTRVSAL